MLSAFDEPYVQWIFVLIFIEKNILLEVFTYFDWNNYFNNMLQVRCPLFIRCWDNNLSLLLQFVFFFILIWVCFNGKMMQTVGLDWLLGHFRVILGMWMENQVMLGLVIPKVLPWMTKEMYMWLIHQILPSER